MSKAINSVINRAEESHDDRNVIKLTCVDMYHPKGSRDRVIIKKRNSNPHTKVVLKAREVTYLYDNDKVSKGTEIVEEVSVPLDKAKVFDLGEPIVVEHVTRDLRTKNDQ
jgi:hypothetical protein